ncbi:MULTISPECIES: IclR family transcriptional regulator [Paraburkholderia]|uniref:IclR family transcriptional regulator n=1 Tax=Paraburkholderia TaxID=1822464 RepID=UPI0004897BA6|nr:MULTISPECIES: IclR family transcriptional regulator [Paraburkholderia]MCP3721371.1 IclR family transcriptional regulator [Paraburkholderia sp. CNPSo 3281]MCP3727085.1 IclR family transcriptional regulator [Paraburkholderia sp. CNPSo 3272]MCX5545759.1 IclR family transcriptional regulator [Paraburkholderia sp. CNPSo 3076]
MKSQSLERGLDVMELLNASQEPMGPREISRRLGLSPAIVQRLLNTLTAKHYLRRDPVTRRYSIGYQTLNMGAALMARDTLLLEARGELQLLADSMRIDGYLGVLQDKTPMYLLCVDGKGPVTVRVQPGSPIGLHNTAIGKAILSSFPDDQALELLRLEPLEQSTAKTITDPEKLVASLHKIRTDGYALIEDEQVMGISSVGALVGDVSGQMRTAISVAYSKHFSPELKRQNVIEAVVAAASRITRNCGFHSG